MSGVFKETENTCGILKFTFKNKNSSHQMLDIDLNITIFNNKKSKKIKKNLKSKLSESTLITFGALGNYVSTKECSYDLTILPKDEIQYNYKSLNNIELECVISLNCF